MQAQFKLLLILSVLSAQAFAATIPVGGPDGCSLANAIRSANQDNSVGNCTAGSGADTIITPDNWTANLTTTLPTIDTDMTIETQTDNGRLAIRSDTIDLIRLIRVRGANTDLVLRNVSITGGRTNFTLGRGAGMNIEDASVTIINSIIGANRATDIDGSGIFIRNGELQLESSIIRFNSVATTGLPRPEREAAIVAVNSDVEVNRSEFYRNSGIEDGPFFGGSIFMDGGTLLFQNSSIQEQSLGLRGNDAIVEIINSSFDELSNDAFLIIFEDSTLFLSHVTMRLSNLSLSDSTLSITNSFIFECGFGNVNVILDAGNYRSDSDCPGLSSFNAPILPLAQNGGPTRTNRLEFSFNQEFNQLINNADQAFCEPFDQRGVARAGLCDVGAYEAADLADVSVEIDLSESEPFGVGQNLTANLVITNNGPERANNVLVDLQTDQAFIQSVNSSVCPTLPCEINTIVADQIVAIPIQINLGGSDGAEFNLDAFAVSTENSLHTDPDESDQDSNNFANVTGTTNLSADLGVEFNLIDQPPYTNNQFVQYEATVSNHGPSTALNVAFNVELDNLDIVSWTGCVTTSGSICNIGGILSGGSRQVTLLAQLNSNIFNSAAEVSGSRLDINPDNNIDSTNNGGGVDETNIAVFLDIITDPPYYSDQFIEFTIGIRAEDPATSIQISYEFPGAELISIEGCLQFPCILPPPFDLAANESLVLDARFFAPIRISDDSDEFEFTVTAIPGQTDVDLGNNTASLSRDLNFSSDIVTQLELISEPPFIAGQEILYELKVGNGGVNNAANVSIDLIPNNLLLVSAFGQQCDTANCVIPQLDFGNQEVITLVYQIEQGGVFNLIAQAFADAFDPGIENNIDNLDNGGFADDAPDIDRIFNDSFESP